MVASASCEAQNIYILSLSVSHSSGRDLVYLWQSRNRLPWCSVHLHVWHVEGPVDSFHVRRFSTSSHEHLAENEYYPNGNKISKITVKCLNATEVT